MNNFETIPSPQEKNKSRPNSENALKKQLKKLKIYLNYPLMN